MKKLKLRLFYRKESVRRKDRTLCASEVNESHDSQSGEAFLVMKQPISPKINKWMTNTQNFNPF